MKSESSECQICHKRPPYCFCAQAHGKRSAAAASGASLSVGLGGRASVRQPEAVARPVGRTEAVRPRLHPLLAEIAANIEADLRWLNRQDPYGESPKFDGAKYAYRRCLTYLKQRGEAGAQPAVAERASPPNGTRCAANEEEDKQ